VLVAVCALICTWAHNLAYLSMGVLAGNIAFWRETLANPASRSITVDIFFLTLAIFVWMFLEARRLDIGRPWIYVVFGLLIAVSVTIPLFLARRERALAALQPGSDGGTLGTCDLCWVGVQLALAAAYVVASFLGRGSA
jgi:hypothetical protein